MKPNPNLTLEDQEKFWLSQLIRILWEVEYTIFLFDDILDSLKEFYDRRKV